MDYWHHLLPKVGSSGKKEHSEFEDWVFGAITKASEHDLPCGWGGVHAFVLDSRVFASFG